MKSCELCNSDRNKLLSMCSLLESIFKMLASFCMNVDRMLKQTLFELSSNGTLCTICGFYVVFTGIWLMWKRLGCVHTLTMLSPWLHCTFSRYVVNNSCLDFCHLIPPAPFYVICSFSNSIMWGTICSLRTVLGEIKINFQLLEIFWR